MTETPSKPDQAGSSAPNQEEETPARPETPHSPRTQPADTPAQVREVVVEPIVGEVVRE